MTLKNILVFTLLAFSASISRAKPELVDKIIATVNSEAVLKSDLDQFESRLKKEGAIDETLLSDASPSALKGQPKAQLEYLINEKLVESEIKRQNLSFTEDRVNEELGSLAKKNRMSRSDLEGYIKKQGFELEDYKKTFKARLERQNFFESEIISKLRISDEDAYNEYKIKNPNYKPNVNEFKISQIFFDPKKGGSEQAFKRAEDVFKKVIAGESYEDLANRFNEEKGANANGYLGQFKTGEFNTDIERAIENLNVGDISPVIQTKIGFHIVKVLDKKSSQDPLFLKYKEQLKASLIERNFKRQLKNWLESKKQEAYIKVYEN